jgi:hypothetical protein
MLQEHLSQSERPGRGLGRLVGRRLARWGFLGRLVTFERSPRKSRCSWTAWVDGGWDVEQSVVLASRLKELGIDLIDVSSGGLVPKARILSAIDRGAPHAASELLPLISDALRELAAAKLARRWRIQHRVVMGTSGNGTTQGRKSSPRGRTEPSFRSIIPPPRLPGRGEAVSRRPRGEGRRGAKAPGARPSPPPPLKNTPP